MIIREIEGKEYKLAVTRRGLREAEKEGMRFDELENKPMSMLYYLWYAALYAAQPMSMKKSDDLLDKYLDDPNTTETFSELLDVLSGDFERVFGGAVE